MNFASVSDLSEMLKFLVLLRQYYLNACIASAS